MRLRRRRRDERGLANAIVGLSAIAVAAALAYVSYNALNGLPFQSRYHVYVLLPDADRLVPTDDVRIANVRVGEVSSVVAQRAPDGTVYARVGLAVAPSVGRLPVDTRVAARSASPLGQTYVDLVPGHSESTVRPDGTLPLARADTSVSVTDLFQIFNGNAAQHFQAATGSIAAGVAGRGAAINDTIAAAARLLPPATRVAGALADPAAGMPHFLSAFGSTASTFASVARQVAGVVSNGAVTLTALSHSRAPLGTTFDLAPSAEGNLTQALILARPALEDTAVLFDRLQASGRLLGHSLTVLDSTLSAGTVASHRLPALTGPLRSTLQVLTAVSRRPATAGAVRKLNDLLQSANPILAAVGPAQAHCNIFGLFMINLSSFFQGAGSGSGPGLVLDSLGEQPPLIEAVQNAKPSPTLHTNPLPVENAKECESNNEPWDPNRQVLGNPPGLQPASTRSTFPPPGVLARARAAGLLAPASPAR